MTEAINQLDNQGFGFGDLDSLQEEVALKNSAQKNKKESDDDFKLKQQAQIDLEYSLAEMKQDLNSKEEKQEGEMNLTSPAQKREYLNETLEIVEKGITPNIKESLGILDKLDEVEAQIAKQEKEFNALNANTEQEKEKDKTNLDSEINEAFQAQLQEQQEKHQKELEALQKEKEALKRNFEASVENLIKQNDIKDLFKNLQIIDKAFADFLKKTKEEADLLAKQRIEKLELAMQGESVKEVVSGFVKELHANRKEVNAQLQELESQKECFLSLDKLQKNASKGDEKAKAELEKEMKAIDKKHPTFKENYPEFYEKLEQKLKEPQKQQEKQQENIKQRSM